MNTPPVLIAGAGPTGLVLAVWLTRLGVPPDNPMDTLLDTYELERIAFARRLVASTDRAFTLVTRRGVAAGFARTRLVPWFAPLLFRLPPLRRFLFKTLSERDQLPYQPVERRCGRGYSQRRPAAIGRDAMQKQLPQSLQRTEERIEAYEWGRQIIANIPEARDLMPDNAGALASVTGAFSMTCSKAKTLVFIQPREAAHIDMLLVLFSIDAVFTYPVVEAALPGR